MRSPDTFPLQRFGATLLAWLLLPLFSVLGLEPIGVRQVYSGGTVLDLSRHFDTRNAPDAFVHVSTSMGSFTLELLPDTSPATVRNFLVYLRSGAYRNALFHRLVPGFILQTGGFSPTGSIPTNPPVVNEYNRSNLRGTVAMAKLGGDPNSATNQWFVNLADNSANLDNQNEGFTVFARVLEPGMTVVDAIASLPQVQLEPPFENLPVRNMADGQQELNLSNLVLITDATVSAFHARSSNPLAFSTEVNGGTLHILPGSEADQGATVTITSKDSQGTAIETTFPVERASREFAVMEISYQTLRGGTSELVWSGTLEFELWPGVAPKTVANFRHLAESGFYNETFFRAVGATDTPLISGGDPLSRHGLVFSGGGPGFRIPEELSSRAERSHVEGVLTMTPDLSPTEEKIPNSVGSRFFILLSDFTALDGNYTSFAKLSSNTNDLFSKLKSLDSNERNKIQVDKIWIRKQSAPLKTLALSPATYSGKMEAQLFAQRPDLKSKSLSATKRASWGNYPLEWFLPMISVPAIGQVEISPAQEMPWEATLCSGNFTVSTTHSGALSGKITHYGRTFPFSGTARPQKDGSYLYSAVLSQPTQAPVGIEVRIPGAHAAESNDSKTLTLQISYDPGFKDRWVLPLAIGQASPAIPTAPRREAKSLLGVLTRPVRFNHAGSPTDPACYVEATQNKPYQIKAPGIFSFRFYNGQKSILASGYLPDGRSLTFARAISQAGGRSLLPFFVCDFLREGQAGPSGSSGPTVDTQSLILDEWCAFSFLRARRFIAGEIEIPQSVSMPKWSAYSWFNSLRENFAERTVPAYYGTSRSTVSEWVEPSPQDRLSLFPSGTGSLEIADPSGGPTAPEHRYPFTVSPNQRTLVFPSHPDLRLLLDTRNGRFTGVFTGTIRDPAANGGTRFVSRGAIRGVLFSPPGAPPDASGLPEAPSKLEGDPTLSAGVGQLLTPVGTFQVNLLRGN